MKKTKRLLFAVISIGLLGFTGCGVRGEPEPYLQLAPQSDPVSNPNSSARNQSNQSIQAPAQFLPTDALGRTLQPPRNESGAELPKVLGN